MRVAIYDAEHFETTYTLVRVLALTENDLTLFVTEEMALALRNLLSEKEDNNLQWVVLPKASVRTTTIIYKHCRNKQIEFLFLSTVSYHHLLFGVLSLLLRKTKTILTIHDANSFFNPAFSPSLRGGLKYCGKKLLAKAVDAYATLLAATADYIKEQYQPAVPVVQIPGSFFLGATTSLPHPELPLVSVIPGSVDTKRRNYAPLFELTQVWPSGKKLEIILAGGFKDAQGLEVLQQLQQLSTEQLRFTVYEQAHVDQKEYDRQLERCDFVYAPLQKMFAEESPVPEQYGLTKSSGCFFDAIRFGKPLLLPDGIFLPEEMAPQTITHSSTTALVAFLARLTTAEKQRITAAAIDNASRFTLQTIREKLRAFLKTLQ